MTKFITGHILLRGISLLAAAVLVLASTGVAGAQNVIVNGDFSEGDAGWTVYQMQGEAEVAGEVFFEASDDCPTGSSPGGCAIMFGSGTAGADGSVNVLLWQEITLIAGTPYTVDARVRFIAEDLDENWSQFYLSTTQPLPFQDWTPAGEHWGFNWWEGCGGAGVDGMFSEHACTGRQTLEFVPPGTAGEEVTYYAGLKSGMYLGPQFIVAIDDVTVARISDAFAVAQFEMEPSGRVLLGDEVTFDASTSTSSGTITSYEWDFGDGTTDAGQRVSHSYSEPGQYPVTLTVTTDEEISNSTTRAVAVWEGIGLPETPLEIPLTSAAPIIDGEREDAWAGAQQISVATHTNNQLPSSPEDLTVDAWVMWDPASFYIFFDVVDDSLHNDSASSWEDDAPEFYLDGGNEKSLETYDSNDEAWELGWDDDAISGRGVNRTAGAEMATLTKADGTGYTVEVKMPWENIGVSPGLGDEIGFEAAINDDDGGGGRNTKLAWFSEPGNDNAWQWSHIWGNAVLVETIASAAEPTPGVPARFAIDDVYPNPFNPSTTAVMSAREAGEYSVRVYNVLGQLVHEHALTVQAPGQIRVPISLEGRASGTYLIRIQHQASGRVATAKVSLLK